MQWWVLLFSFLVILGPSSGYAAKLASYCSLVEEDPQGVVEGFKVNDMLPIASVSKLVTTYWALAVMNPTDRFTTKIYITPVANKNPKIKVVDLHFEGSRDPYFGKESIHYLISELNKKGIFHVRNASFDSNFKFFWNVAGGPVIHNPRQRVEFGYYQEDSPTPKEVAAELRAFRNNWAQGYNYTRNYLKQFNIHLLPTARLSVTTVKHVESHQFTPATNTEVRFIHSSPLMMLLREMNRNSNNHSANQIFERLGGTERFQKFVKSIGLSENDIIMFNGHGNRHDMPDGAYYNSATCSAIVKIIARLSKLLQGMGRDVDDVLPVPAMDRNSSVRGYQNKIYAEAMAAKTGTVGPAVTLAGLMKTKKGRVFFMYNIATRHSEEDWARARRQIAVRLVTLAQKHNGGKAFDSHQMKFISFDPELFFQEEQQISSVDAATVGQLESQQSQNP